MTSIVPGDYVFPLADMKAWSVRGYEQQTLKAGQDLLVRSVSKSGQWLNVQAAKWQRVVRVEVGTVTMQGRRLGEMPPDGIAPDDPRVAWIFEDAARLADRRGYCNVFDAITDELNLPGRVRKFTLTYEVVPGVKLQAKIEARSRALAEDLLRQKMTGAPLPLALESGKS
jgi:hypothetical protein